MKRLTLSSRATCGRSRAITSSAVAVRPSSLGRSAMKKLPVLAVVPPAKTPKAVTSGSLRTTSEICSKRSLVATNDASCAVSAKP